MKILDKAEKKVSRGQAEWQKQNHKIRKRKKNFHKREDWKMY